MDILQINDVEDSTQLNDINQISNSVGIGGNNNVSVSEAEKRLKKLERDYQHSYEKYIETRANWRRFYIKANHSNYRSAQAGYCIKYYQERRDRLKNDLEKLNRSEAEQRGIERSPVHCKEFSKLHSCKSLTKENKILQQIEETQQQHVENNDNVQKTIHYRRGNWEVKDLEKSRDYNPTRQEGLITRIEMEIKVLTKVINKIKKEERGMETRVDYEYKEKIEELKKKCDWICGKWDEEKKNVIGLKKTQDVF